MGIKGILSRVPWIKFFLLWFLGIGMGAALLWPGGNLTSNRLGLFFLLVVGLGLGLLWATTRFKWQRTYCSYCLHQVSAHATRFDPDHKVWVMIYECDKCGHITEKSRNKKIILDPHPKA